MEHAYAQPVGDERPHGPLVVDALTEVAPRHPTEPLNVALNGRHVEAELA